MNLLISLFLFSWAILTLSQPPCKFTDKEGHYYDLTPLSKAPVSGSDGQDYTYTVSICSNSLPQPCEITNGQPTPDNQRACVNQVGYCQTGINSHAGYGFCIGTSDNPTDTAGIPGGKGVTIYYQEPRRVVGRSGTVTINCNPSSPLVGPVKAISPTPNAPEPHYELIFESWAGCPASISGGTIILIIFFALVFIYIIGGIGFNYVKNNARTPQELFPHLEFWKSVPGLIQDGVTFTIKKFKSLVGKE